METHNFFKKKLYKKLKEKKRMGIGFTLLISIFILTIVSIVGALLSILFYKKTTFFRSFKNIFLSLIIFFIISNVLEFTINLLRGYDHGSFGDTWFIEVQDNYTLDFIDTLDEATLKQHNKVISHNSKAFGEEFLMTTYKNFIILKESKEPNKLHVINTLSGKEKDIQKISELNITKALIFQTPKEYYLEQSQKRLYYLQSLIVFIISIFLTAFIMQKRLRYNKT
jgi:hypothetical protein